jgi:hypothetical protein
VGTYENINLQLPEFKDTSASSQSKIAQPTSRKAPGTAKPEKLTQKPPKITLDRSTTGTQGSARKKNKKPDTKVLHGTDDSD